MFSSAPLWQRVRDPLGPHGAEELLKAGDNLGRKERPHLEEYLLCSGLLGAYYIY